MPPPLLLLRPRRRRRPAVLVVLLLASVLLFLAQPPNGQVRLAVRFNMARLADFVLAGWLSGRDGRLQEARARHWLHLGTDVGFLIKTGYGTRGRLPAQLDAFARGRGDMLGDPGRGFLVVGDWGGVNASDVQRLGVDVVDAVALVLEAKGGDDDGGLGQHPRFDKYRSLQAAIVAGDEKRAAILGQAYGWELDALKFIVGIELAYRRMPHKKWYMILDDDTYLIRPSLELLLSHLEPDRPQYIGNAVGDYMARFAHGGSAVLLSAEALRLLFRQPDVVADAYRMSLNETWGDRLVATTLQRVGVYLEERYSHHFNGESPEMTRLSKDRLCSLIVSFHGLRTAGAMASVGRVLAGVEKPVTWGQLWSLFSPLPMERLGRKPALPGDHVGPRDEHTETWPGVQDDDACRASCERSHTCLAWTFEPDYNACYGSPWVVVGQPHDRPSPSLSGVNWRRIEPLMRQCPLATLSAPGRQRLQNLKTPPSLSDGRRRRQRRACVRAMPARTATGPATPTGLVPHTSVRPRTLR